LDASDDEEMPTVVRKRNYNNSTCDARTPVKNLVSRVRNVSKLKLKAKKLKGILGTGTTAVTPYKTDQLESSSYEDPE
jgi:hypothetical protein